MTNKSADQPARPTLQSLGDLVVPRRPSGVSHQQGDDYDAQALLAANGYSDETEALLQALDSDLGILQAAAARMLGARDTRDAIDRLKQASNNKLLEETVQVQAAYALARMAVPSGQERLVALLALSPEASPAPLQASGMLAQLGDPRGFSLVRTALDSPNPVTAMVAVKQLYAFVPFDGQVLPDEVRIDISEAYHHALKRSEANITGEAKSQRDELNLT